MSDLRADLAAILVDREEQHRLDNELGIDMARVDVEFGVGLRAVRARQLLAEHDALEDLAEAVREMVKMTGHIYKRRVPPRHEWDSMTLALAQCDAVKDGNRGA